MTQPESPRVFEARPPDLQPSAADDEFAERFIEIARLIEGCRRYGKVSLLMSTCRNGWMTVNAVFYDIKRVLAPSWRRDLASESLVRLEQREYQDADKAAREALALLAQAREKVEVWGDRMSLIAEFEEQVEALPRIAKRRVTRWYEGQKAGRAPGVQPHQQKYVALNLDEDDDAAAALAVLVEAEARLRLVLNLVTHATVLLNAQPDDLTLFEAAPDEGRYTRDDTWERLRLLLASGAERLGARWTSNGDDAQLSFADGHQLSVARALPEIAERRALISDLRSRAADVLDDVHRDLTEYFRPNVAEKPLPDPYILDVRPRHASRSGEGRAFAVETVRATTDQLPDVVRVAALEAGMPEDVYSHDDPDLYVYDRATREGARRARELALAAIDAAAAADAQLLALPEVFIPRGAATEIFDAARSRGIALVGGLEYENVSGRAVNEAAIVIPGVGDAITQRKQRPSVYEVREALFDANCRLTVVRDSPVGVFATIVCSDYLELDLLWRLASQPDRLDLVIVVSRNPNPEVFTALAQADAARLHAYVMVVNSFAPHTDGALPSGRGTIVAQPHAKQPLLAVEHVELPTKWPAIAPPLLALADLHIKELRRMDTGRHSRRFLRPPNFPRRG